MRFIINLRAQIIEETEEMNHQDSPPPCPTPPHPLKWWAFIGGACTLLAIVLSCWVSCMKRDPLVSLQASGVSQPPGSVNHSAPQPCSDHGASQGCRVSLFRVLTWTLTAALEETL